MNMHNGATDAKLGMLVRQKLRTLELENGPDDEYPSTVDQLAVQDLFAKIMQTLGLNLRDPSIEHTPRRVAKMYCTEIFYGLDYNNFPKCTTFPRERDELIVVDEIELKSMCEHHWMPFIGQAAVGYVPNKHVMGLSKFNRVVDFYARRPQIQERLNEQILEALKFILQTEDVAVIIRAEHHCMKMRGVQDFTSNTITSKISGRFYSVQPLREEFMRLSRVARN